MLKIRYMQSDFTRRFNVALINDIETTEGRKRVAAHVEMKEVSDCEETPTAASFHDMNEARAFIMSAVEIAEEMGWLKGYTGQIDAISNHLQDMRKLVFKADDQPLP